MVQNQYYVPVTCLTAMFLAKTNQVKHMHNKMISLYIVPWLPRDVIMIFLTLIVHIRPVLAANEVFAPSSYIFVLSNVTHNTDICSLLQLAIMYVL